MHYRVVGGLGLGRFSILLGLSAAAMAGTARGALVINLVFPDGSNAINITSADAGREIPILVYGTVTGLPVTQTPGATSGNFDGINYAYYNIVSSVGNGGGLAGGIDSGAINAAFGPQLNGAPGGFGNYGYGFNNTGSQKGVAQDINGDGIADLGSNTNISQIAKPRSFPPIFNNADSTAFGAPNPTGAANIIVSGSDSSIVSFLLETVYFQVGASPALGQSTSFKPAPVQTQNFGPYVQTNYFVNDPTNVVTTGGQNTFTSESAGTSVTVTVVPEPTTLLTMLCGGLLLGRRRRKLRV